MRDRLKNKRGAALIESCLVIIMLCLILFGLLQVSYLLGARDIIAYASVGVARSASVGSDDFMLLKTTRMLTIPTGGPMLAPSSVTRGADVYGDTEGRKWDMAVETSPENEQYWTERFLIPFFLGTESYAESRAVLDYANWMQGATRVASPELHGTDTIEELILDTPVHQYVPLAMPFARVFYRENLYPLWREGTEHPSVPHAFIRESAAMENHAAYYMTNGVWTAL